MKIKKRFNTKKQRGIINVNDHDDDDDGLCNVFGLSFFFVRLHC